MCRFRLKVKLHCLHTISLPFLCHGTLMQSPQIRGLLNGKTCVSLKINISNVFFLFFRGYYKCVSSFIVVDAACKLDISEFLDWRQLSIQSWLWTCFPKMEISLCNLFASCLHMVIVWSTYASTSTAGLCPLQKTDRTIRWKAIQVFLL